MKQQCYAQNINLGRLLTTKYKTEYQKCNGITPWAEYNICLLQSIGKILLNVHILLNALNVIKFNKS